MTPSTEPAVRAARRRRWSLVAGVAVLVTGAFVGGALLAGSRSGSPTSDEHAAMAHRAAQVMPFDLNATTHTFTDTADGGVEAVVADDVADGVNTDAIRGHLSAEAAAFAAGDFTDPATIHGADMPGLAQLAAGAGRLQVTYAELPGGASITYRSSDPALVAAVHAWFDRQRSDHSMPGMGMGH